LRLEPVAASQLRQPRASFVNREFGYGLEWTVLAMIWRRSGSGCRRCCVVARASVPS
jgi:hypothetical protein